MVRKTIKFSLIFCLLSIALGSNCQNINECYCAFNTCDFRYDNDIERLRELTILRYRIVNNVNKERRFLCQYYLVSNRKDTFNIISVFKESSTDTFIKENRLSKNWVFKKIELDSCEIFYSQFNLSNEIDRKYKVLLGRFFGEID